MYSGLESTAIWPRRRTVSRGSLTRMAAVEARNLAAEKVIGEAWLSSRNLARRTRGVERVKSGWMRELRMVGTASMEWTR